MPFVLEWVESHRTRLRGGHGAGQVANMNVPSCTTGDIKEPVEVPLAPLNAPGALTAAGLHRHRHRPADDVAAFNAGYVTITDPIPAVP